MAKRNVLPLKRKIDLLNEIETKKQKQADVACKYNVSQATVSVILKNSKKLKEQFYSGEVNAKVKRQRLPHEPKVDIALLSWFKKARANNIPVSGSVLRLKAEEFAKDMGLCDWTCSEGWVRRFTTRHDITFRKISGERNSVDECATDSWVNDVLLPNLHEYDENDIFNMDESGVFWRMLPDRTLAFRAEKCHGGKLSKDRLTVAMCCNMTGTEKRRLLVIGKFRSPRCFKGIKNLPVIYEASPKTWMTMDLFEKWLRDFDCSMHSMNRKVLLVLDNCTAHVKVDGLKATKLLFLPANATAKLQPLDTGIIKNLKFFYRTRLLTKLIAHAESSGSDFQINLLDALQNLKASWDQVTATTIKNSFRHAGFVLPKDADDSANSDRECRESLLTSSIEPILSKLYKDFGVSLEDYYSFDDHVASCAPPSSETGSTCIPTPVEEPNSESDLDDGGGPSSTVSKAEAMSAVWKLDLYLMQGEPDVDARKSFDRFKVHLQNLMLRNVGVQTKMTDFLFCQEKQTRCSFRKNDWEQDSNTGEEIKSDMKSEISEINSDSGIWSESSWIGQKREQRASQTKQGSSPTGQRSGQTGQGYDQTGQSFGQTGYASGQTGQGYDQAGHSSGQTEQGYDQTGQSSGQTGHSSGQTGQGYDQTGQSSGQRGSHQERINLKGKSEKAGKIYCRNDTDTCGDLIFEGYEAGRQLSFKPTGSCWRREHARQLGLPDPLPLPERKAKGTLGEPFQINNVIGDGNCLYRALSLEVVGTQNYHEQIRAKIVDFMLQNPSTFEGYVGRDIGNYILEHNLPLRSWGGDPEIYAAATLLQTSIVVYTPVNEARREWIQHRPLFYIPSITFSQENIYLRNLCGHFERVVSVR